MKHLWAVCVVACVWRPASARADDVDDVATDERGERLSVRDERLYAKLSAPRGAGYARIRVGTGFGRGFRFNNPYRLATPLGDTPESVSLTASYWDLAAVALFGDPDGLQHGGRVGLSVALEGVSQQALALSYVAYGKPIPYLALHGRAGPSILLSPDANVGFEAAVGVTALATGAVGLEVEGVGALFYGAATYETQFTVIPILALQASLVVDVEVLP